MNVLYAQAIDYPDAPAFTMRLGRFYVAAMWKVRFRQAV